MGRKYISPRTRFAVLKRDGFACTYCGARAPQAILVIDHIEPLALGGDDDLGNYAAACQTCNASKGAQPVLTDMPTYPEEQWTEEEEEILNWVYVDHFTDKRRYVEIAKEVRAAHPLPPGGGGEAWAEWDWLCMILATQRMCIEIMQDAGSC